ncbi:hypothetical protein [Roseomonas sp. BN140053]|uniref:hypothetical protein n=1 Tax=Roseomonas sp. BN140053 TaxID=3391898 RepID=UPI0039ECB646
MLGIAPVVLALDGGATDGTPWTRLLAPRALNAPAGFARASRAAGFDASGTRLEVAADLPRFSAANGLLVEEARVNGVRNPRAEGAAATGGSGFLLGTTPTFWTRGTAAGITNSIVGSGVQDGIPYVDIRFSGTATANTTSLNWATEQPTGCPAVAGEVWTSSWFGVVVAGSLSGINGVSANLYELNASSGITATSSAAWVPGSGALRSSRFAITRSFTNAATAFTRTLHFLNVSSGAAIDITLRFGAPQYEKGSFASFPILPLAGTPGAGSRAADLPSWQPPGGFGTAGTVVARCTLPQAAAAIPQGLWQIDDGTDSNRIVVRNAGGLPVTAEAEGGGTASATLTGGSMAVGMPFRAALAWAPGELAFCITGGAVQRAIAAIPTGLSRLLVGHAAGALNRALNGEISVLDHTPARLPDADLLALAAAG